MDFGTVIMLLGLLGLVAYGVYYAWSTGKLERFGLKKPTPKP